MENLIISRHPFLWDDKLNNKLVGKWCLNLNEKKNNFNIVDYHWNNNEKFKSDYIALSKTYENLLKKIVPILNLLNKKKYSKSFWELLIHRWLWLAITNMYDRWEIVNSLSSELNINLNYIKFDKFFFLPNDTKEFNDKIQLDDNWSHFILLKILEFRKDKFKKIIFNLVKEIKVENKIIKKSKIKKIKKNFLFSSINDQIFLKDLNFSLWEKVFLCFLNKQLPTKNYTPSLEFNDYIDKDKRVFFEKNISHEKNFEDFFIYMLQFCLPKIFFENFDQLEKIYDDLDWPKKPKYILTSTAHFHDDVFKFYVSKKRNLGTKFIIYQHGGFYGNAEYIFSEHIEKKICDRFLTWGWKDKNDKTFPFFFFSVQKIKS